MPKKKPETIYPVHHTHDHSEGVNLEVVEISIFRKMRGQISIPK